MVVIRTAVEREVSGSGRFSCVGIVGRFVRPEYVAFVVDLNRSVQLVNRAFLFLLDGANGVNVAFFLLLGSRQGAGCRRSSCRFSAGAPERAAAPASAGGNWLVTNGGTRRR